jgi:hypothetical protein
MTAILKELRLLEAEHAGGRITDAELARRKTTLMHSVPDANEVEAGPAVSQDVARSTPSAAPKSVSKPEMHTPPDTASSQTNPWDMLALLLVAAALCGAAVLLIVGDIAMAMTFGITVLAAFTIKLFLMIDD